MENKITNLVIHAVIIHIFVIEECLFHYKMPRKKSLEEFIAEAATIHNNKYNYSKVVYKNSSEKIVVTCKSHGDFLISPHKHLIGQGCRICNGYVALTQLSFLERSNDKHGKLYDYSKTEVKSKHNKVVIICKLHGEFEQLPSNHIKGQGCPECAQIVRAKSQRYTSQEFINSVQTVHLNKYDYSKVNYVNSQTKVEIICPLHGSFNMKPNSHYNGQGCPECGKINARNNIALDYSVFLERAELVHNNRYIYQKDSYVNYTTKMAIFCNDHGFFEQTPHSHISMKTGCPKCGILNTAKKNQIGWDTVYDLFLVAHGNKYEYDQSSFGDVSSKMKIKCSKHGWFTQKPYAHYGGSGCNKCAVEEVHDKQKIDFKEFVKRSLGMHGNVYSYNKSNFTDIFTAVEIECSKHGVFSQKPRDHYRGSGCPKCLSSRGETLVRLILERQNIRFEEQKKFEDLTHINMLRCDFYLPDYNTVIEYNGLQHYLPISVFGGIDGLIQTQKRDLIKYDYLQANKIQLIIIRYDNRNPKEYLLEKLKIQQK